MIDNPNPTHAEFNEEEARHYRAVLRKLVDIAMDEAANIQAEQPQPGPAKPDRSIRFERIARTIRRCILLARKLAEPLPIPRPMSGRESILREAERPIDCDAERADRPDRLDAPDPVDDLTRRPIHEIVAEIARDLGIHPAKTHSFEWTPGTPEKAQTPNVRAAAILAEPPPLNSAPARVPTWCPERPDDPAGSAATLLRLARPPNKPAFRPPKH